MGKKKVIWELYSYGIYSSWDKSSKSLPKLRNITTDIPIEPGIEYGYVIKISGAKGKKLEYKIHHPPMKDENNLPLPPFEGTIIINSNNYDFFLGDTVWEPFEQMAGYWTLTTKLEGKTIAEKKLKLYLKNN